MLMEKQKKQTTNTLMTVKDVATYLAVTERTVYRLVKDHKLPAYKVGGQWRFKADMIEGRMQKDGALETLDESASEQESDTSRSAWTASRRDTPYAACISSPSVSICIVRGTMSNPCPRLMQHRAS